MGNQGEAEPIKSAPQAVGHAFGKTGRIGFGVVGIQLLAPSIASPAATLRLETNGDSIALEPADLVALGKWITAQAEEFRQPYEEARKTEGELDMVSRFAKLFGLV